jgi:hypothetical protein
MRSKGPSLYTLGIPKPEASCIGKLGRMKVFEVRWLSWAENLISGAAKRFPAEPFSFGSEDRYRLILKLFQATK